MARAVGNNAFVLKGLPGHTRIATTERYIHPTTPEVPIDLSACMTKADAA